MFFGFAFCFPLLVCGCSLGWGAVCGMWKSHWVGVGFGLLFPSSYLPQVWSREPRRLAGNVLSGVVPGPRDPGDTVPDRFPLPLPVPGPVFNICSVWRVCRMCLCLSLYWSLSFSLAFLQLHLDVIWITSGSHLDYIWKSLGLHLEVVWTRSAHDLDYIRKSGLRGIMPLRLRGIEASSF